MGLFKGLNMCVYLYAPMCTCACMCVYIYVEYASIHTTSIHIYLNVCTCTNNIHTHTCVRTYISVYMHVCGEDALVSQHLSSTQYHIINYDHPAVR